MKFHMLLKFYLILWQFFKIEKSNNSPLIVPTIFKNIKIFLKILDHFL